MPYIGNTGGVLAGGSPGIKYADTTSLSFTRVGTAWKFSLTNISPEVQRLIDAGYIVKIYYVAYVPGGSKTRVSRSAKEDPDGFIYTKWKPNQSLDITSLVNTTPTNFDLTEWFNSALTFCYNKEIRTKAIQLDYDDYGVWYRHFKLAITINNVFYGTTPEYIAQYECPPGTPILVDLALTEVYGNTLTFYT